MYQHLDYQFLGHLGGDRPAWQQHIEKHQGHHLVDQGSDGCRILGGHCECLAREGGRAPHRDESLHIDVDIDLVLRAEPSEGGKRVVHSRCPIN